jgi:hypothetical protein
VERTTDTRKASSLPVEVTYKVEIFPQKGGNCLIEKGNWKERVKSELSRGTSVMGGRFVVSNNDMGTLREVYKACHAVQGLRDRDMTHLVKQPMTARQLSRKLLVSLVAIIRFRIYTNDVQQTYFQCRQLNVQSIYLPIK